MYVYTLCMHVYMYNFNPLLHWTCASQGMVKALRVNHAKTTEIGVGSEVIESLSLFLTFRMPVKL